MSRAETKWDHVGPDIAATEYFVCRSRSESAGVGVAIRAMKADGSQVVICMTDEEAVALMADLASQLHRNLRLKGKEG